ncbi:MAG: hypothetical protein ACLFNW_05695 [Desulfobacterales bacterium]
MFHVIHDVFSATVDTVSGHVVGDDYVFAPPGKFGRGLGGHESVIVSGVKE